MCCLLRHTWVIHDHPLHPALRTLNSKPSTPNPQPSTPNPQPSTLNPQPSTLNPQPPTRSFRRRRHGGTSVSSARASQVSKNSEALALAKELLLLLLLLLLPRLPPPEAQVLHENKSDTLRETRATRCGKQERHAAGNKRDTLRETRATRCGKRAPEPVHLGFDELLRSLPAHLRLPLELVAADGRKAGNLKAF
jgi:hypothetical protein